MNVAIGESMEASEEETHADGMNDCPGCELRARIIKELQEELARAKKDQADLARLVRDTCATLYREVNK